MPDPLAHLLALALAGHLAAWRYTTGVDPWMYAAIPAVYVQCARQIRRTLDLTRP